MTNFNTDLSFGQKYEDIFIKTQNIKKYKRPEGKFKPYDIKEYKENNKVVHYEIKSDRLAYRTGNITIEFHCYKSPSGISTTRASKWVYFIVKPNGEYDMYIIPTKKIRKFIDERKYKRIVKGGDNLNSSMYLFDVNIFESYLTV